MTPAPSPRSTILGTRWTADEDAVLLRHYQRRGPTWCAQRLPGRTPKAVRARARRLGVCQSVAVPWTRAEVTVLRRAWGELSERGLRARLPGRTWCAIATRAALLGLPDPNQGTVSLRSAALRAGMRPITLRRILAAEGVALPRRVRRRPEGGPVAFRWRVVDLDAAMAAVRRHDNRCATTLSLVEACARHHTDRLRMHRALALLARSRPVAGLPAEPGARARWRLLPTDVDAAMALLRGAP